MSSVIRIVELEEKILEIRGQRVLLDRDIAEIYKVETKRINEAVKNNPEKFPQDYYLVLNEGEFVDLRSKFSTTSFAKTRVAPKAFTEKGLYMLATILKSSVATQATITIIEAFENYVNSLETLSKFRTRKTRWNKSRLCKEVVS